MTIDDVFMIAGILTGLVYLPIIFLMTLEDRRRNKGRKGGYKR